MKKVLKNGVLILVMAVLMLGLVACGSDKLTATKETEEMGAKYKEKFEVSFKDDKVEKIEFTFDFENEDDATEMYEGFKLINELSGKEEWFKNIEQNGKEVKGEVSVKGLLGDDADNEINKEELKKKLEEEGYTVK